MGEIKTDLEVAKDMIQDQVEKIKKEMKRKDDIVDINKQLEKINNDNKKTNVVIENIINQLDEEDKVTTVHYKESESTIELTKAIIECQKKMGSIEKNSTNPHFGSQYADLNIIREKLRSILSENDIVVHQFPVHAGGGKIGVKTIVKHISGEFIESDTVAVKPEKNDIQKYGSIQSYLCRYALNGIFQLSFEIDDDGNSSNSTQDKLTSEKTVRKKSKLESKLGTL